MVVSRSRTSALGYGDLTLGGAELEEAKSLRILGITLESKLIFVTHLREVMLKAARSLNVMRQTGKLFGCRHTLICSRVRSLIWFYCYPCGKLC